MALSNASRISCSDRAPRGPCQLHPIVIPHASRRAAMSALASTPKLECYVFDDLRLICAQYLAVCLPSLRGLPQKHEEG